MEEQRKIPPAVDNEPYLQEELKDPEFVAEFLNVAIEEYLIDQDIRSFNAILGSIVKSGNVSQIAKRCNMSRSQIYRMIKGDCEPNFLKTLKILNALGYEFKVQPIEKTA